MRQLSFGLRGKSAELATQLDNVLGQKVKSLELSKRGWEEFVIGLQFDPCPKLFRRLLDEAKVARPVQFLTDSTINGKLILLTPERFRVGFELGGYGLLKVSIGFDRDHMEVAGAMAKRFYEGQAVFVEGSEAKESAVTR